MNSPPDRDAVRPVPDTSGRKKRTPGPKPGRPPANRLNWGAELSSLPGTDRSRKGRHPSGPKRRRELSTDRTASPVSRRSRHPEVRTQGTLSASAETLAGFWQNSGGTSPAGPLPGGLPAPRSPRAVTVRRHRGQSCLSLPLCDTSRGSGSATSPCLHPCRPSQGRSRGRGPHPRVRSTVPGLLDGPAATVRKPPRTAADKPKPLQVSLKPCPTSDVWANEGLTFVKATARGLDLDQFLAGCSENCVAGVPLHPGWARRNR